MNTGTFSGIGESNPFTIPPGLMGVKSFSGRKTFEPSDIGWMLDYNPFSGIQVWTFPHSRNYTFDPFTMLHMRINRSNDTRCQFAFEQGVSAYVLGNVDPYPATGTLYCSGPYALVTIMKGFDEIWYLTGTGLQYS